jgi:hypothetical protein
MDRLHNHHAYRAPQRLVPSRKPASADLPPAKLQMQTHSHVKLYSGPWDCARQIVKVRGVPGLWHAFPATLLFRSFFGPMYLSYELMLREFKKRNVGVLKPRVLLTRRAGQRGQGQFLRGRLV